MKTLYTIILILIFTACKAQIAVPLYKADHDLPGNVYYKDLDHDLDKFVGIWKWENGTESWTIKLFKKTKVYNSTGKFYEDMIIGEYEYDGEEDISTLINLQDNTIVGYKHNISGSIILHKNFPPKCADCNIDERRILLFYSEPSRANIHSEMVLRYIIEQGVEKIELKLYTTSVRFSENPNSPQHTIVPNGEYTLIKQ